MHPLTHGKKENGWKLFRWENKWWLIFPGIFLVFVIWFYFLLPSSLFKDPYSLALFDSQGQLLGARIAEDGQWRFPPLEIVPEKYAKAVISFEDKRFNFHPGVDPIAVARSLWLNITKGNVVSGASTISMQTIRLCRKNNNRNYFEKMVEIIWAIRLELGYSKKKIMALYASHAPYGGNVVGVETASWRYFQRDINQLSWSEYCLLAVLPNSPGLIHPGRNRVDLRNKRNKLLKKLASEHTIDSTTLQLALLESIPESPKALPELAPHLLAEIKNTSKELKKGSRIKTSIKKSLQESVNSRVQNHLKNLSGNFIHNAAALIIDVENSKVVAYVGNCWPPNKEDNNCYVDVIQSSRSTGSILKPLLYGAALQSGEITPKTLLADVPTSISGYSPKNFNRDYEGAVSAWQVLARSLNVPSVRMLQMFGVERFYDFLKSMGIRTLTRPAEDYGLSLILGSGEATLWDITNIYAGLSQALQSGNSQKLKWSYASLLRGENPFKILPGNGVLDPGSAWLTVEAMVEVARPDEDGAWKNYASGRPIAWKTGTSIGFKDAWAVGVTPKYAIGVWVGNADGEGRPGLVGVQVAAPLLFQLFELLPPSEWFQFPRKDLQEMTVCPLSGHPPNPDCPGRDTLWMPFGETKLAPCPYHKLVHLDGTASKRVRQSCEEVSKMKSVPWFVLPPNQEWFYLKKHSGYLPLPPWRPDCVAPFQEIKNMDLIYPNEGTRVFIPVTLSGKKSRTIFEASHRNPKAEIHWHLDGRYLTTTLETHNLELYPKPGKHQLTLIDSDGQKLVRSFVVVGE